MSAKVPWFEGGRDPGTVLSLSAKGSLRTYTQQTYALMINKECVRWRVELCCCVVFGNKWSKPEELAAAWQAVNSPRSLADHQHTLISIC